MSDVIAAVAGAVVGGVIGSLSPLLHAYVQERRKQRNILRTLMGEVIAIASSTAQNDLATRMTRILETSKAGRDFVAPTLFDERLDPAPIYGGLIDQLGALDPEHVAFLADFHRSLKIARFRYLAFQGKTVTDGDLEEFQFAVNHILSELQRLPEYKSEAERLIR